MIRFFLLQNKSGKTRLSKYYHPFADDEKMKMENEIHRIFMQRDASFTNFVEVRLEYAGKPATTTTTHHSLSACVVCSIRVSSLCLDAMLDYSLYLRLM